MNELSGIVVLCIIVLIPIAFYVGTQNPQIFDVFDNDTRQEQIDPPSLELETGPEDTTVETATVKVSNVVNLSNQGLTSVPEYVFSQKKTEELNLSNNNLRGSLQAEIRHLENLRVLNLSKNNFTGVPAEVGQLSQLEILNLSGNPITGLPYELGNLKNLKVLDLRNTNYSKEDLEVITNGLPSSVSILK